MKIFLMLGQENRFSFYSAFFRLFICFHLLKDLLQVWSQIPLIYGGDSFYHESPTFLLEYIGIKTEVIRNNINAFLTFYIGVIILFFFGIGKNFAAFLLFISYEIVQRLCPVILNGGDNLLRFCILYMVFIDSFGYFSVYKSKQYTQNFSIRNFLSNLGGLSICLHLCVAYFFSAIHKFHSDVWFNGIATYYILSLERFNGTPYNTSLSTNGYFVTLTTYLTLLIEISYPFLIWFKRTRYLLIISAILMHTGIYIFMMIYDFQIIFIVLQGFFIPNTAWKNIYLWFKQKTKKWMQKKYRTAL